MVALLETVPFLEGDEKIFEEHFTMFSGVVEHEDSGIVVVDCNRGVPGKEGMETSV